MEISPASASSSSLLAVYLFVFPVRLRGKKSERARSRERELAVAMVYTFSLRPSLLYLHLVRFYVHTYMVGMYGMALCTVYLYSGSYVCVCMHGMASSLSFFPLGSAPASWSRLRTSASPLQPSLHALCLTCVSQSPVLPHFYMQPKLILGDDLINSVESFFHFGAIWTIRIL